MDLPKIGVTFLFFYKMKYSYILSKLLEGNVWCRRKEGQSISPGDRLNALLTSLDNSILDASLNKKDKGAEICFVRLVIW